MLLLTNCEVHTENVRTAILKYEKLRSEYFPVWTELIGLIV